MEKGKLCKLGTHKLFVVPFIEEVRDGNATERYVYGICLVCNDIVQNRRIYNQNCVIHIKNTSVLDIAMFFYSKIKEIYEEAKKQNFEDKTIKKIIEYLYNDNINQKNDEEIMEYRKSLNQKSTLDLICEAVKNI